MSKMARTKACRNCAEKLKEKNYLYEVGQFSNGGICPWCNKFHPTLTLYEFENKEEVEKRKAKKQREVNNYRSGPDNRARWREPWRGE